MIAGLRGSLAAKMADAVLIDVSGVIYRVGTSANTVSAVGDVGDAVRLLTHLFVREDQLTLYGFVSEDELKLFETLISVTGVGPRLACAILSTLRVETLLQAIEAGNADLLATVPGVGKRTAARLIVELRGKLPTTDSGSVSTRRADAEVVAALRALGYTLAEAQAAAGQVADAENLSAEDRVLAALRAIGQ